VKVLINIVRNGSFEENIRCPFQIDQLKYARYWNGIDTINGITNCAPEYYNVCDTTRSYGIPINFAGFQYPRTGKGYSGGKMYYDEIPFAYSSRDYIQGRLFKVLTTGKNYCVTFYVNVATISEYAVNRIGAYLDNGSIDTATITCGLPQINYVPQIVSSIVIDDTLNWIKVQGSFIANGTETFITIGNFYDKTNTDTIIRFPGSSYPIGYYYVDDVSVIESTEVAHAGPDVSIVAGDSVHIGTNEEGMPCTWYMAGDTMPVGYSGGIWVKPTVTTTYVVEMDLCGNVTRDSVKVTVWPVGETSPRPSAKGREVLPNPVQDELHVVGEAGDVVRIYDVVGKEVYRKDISSENEVINIGALQKGIYLIHVVVPGTGQRFVRRVVKE